MDDLDRHSFLQRVHRVVARYEWRVYALCLMSNHFHLVVSFDEPTLADGMRIISGGHARQFNARHGRRGPLFESRYSDTHIVAEDHLLACVRYVAQNPVTAGFVEEPQDWPWSTYGQLIGVAHPWPFFNPAEVLALFDARWENAIRIVRDFVEVPGTVGARH